MAHDEVGNGVWHAGVLHSAMTHLAASASTHHPALLIADALTPSVAAFLARFVDETQLNTNSPGPLICRGGSHIIVEMDDTRALRPEIVALAGVLRMRPAALEADTAGRTGVGTLCASFREPAAVAGGLRRDRLPQSHCCLPMDVKRLTSCASSQHRRCYVSARRMARRRFTTGSS
jgi:hypothetical protein